MKVKELIEILRTLSQDAEIKVDTVSSYSVDDWYDIEKERIHIYSDQYIGKEKEEIVCIDVA